MRDLSESDRQDLSKLVTALVPFAQQMLAKRDAFFPFGAVMDNGGTIALMAGVTPDTGETERPNSQAIIDLLVAGFKAKHAVGEIRACAVCYDGRVEIRNEGGLKDAICIDLEHRTAGAMMMAVRYHKGLLGRYRYEVPVKLHRAPLVFVG